MGSGSGMEGSLGGASGVGGATIGAGAGGWGSGMGSGSGMEGSLGGTSGAGGGGDSSTNAGPGGAGTGGGGGGATNPSSGGALMVSNQLIVAFVTTPEVAVDDSEFTRNGTPTTGIDSLLP